MKVTDLNINTIIQALNDQILSSSSLNTNNINNRVNKNKLNNENVKIDLNQKQLRYMQSSTGIQYPVTMQQNQTQKKKKRNRVSAQVSRDRKKQYLLELQEQNRQLRHRQQQFERIVCQKTRLELETHEKNKIISLQSEKLLMEQNQRIMLMIEKSELENQLVKIKREFVYNHYGYYQFAKSNILQESININKE